MRYYFIRTNPYCSHESPAQCVSDNELDWVYQYNLTTKMYAVSGDVQVECWVCKKTAIMVVPTEYYDDMKSIVAAHPKARLHVDPSRQAPEQKTDGAD